MFYSSKDPEQLQSVINEELGKILKFINFKNTNYMIITSPKKKTNIRITACNIEQKSQIKYLGVVIDEHLKWDAQLQHINNKITKNIGILFELRHYVPISTFKQLYYTLIYPCLTYRLMNWGTAYQNKLNKFKVSQNNCICCIFLRERESPTPYFTLLEILKLENIFKLKIGALVHKIQYQKKDTPPALYDLVQPASAVRNYNTSYATNQNLCRPFSRTNYGLARFSVVASQTWEATPMKIVSPRTVFYLTVRHLV